MKKGELEGLIEKNVKYISKLMFNLLKLEMERLRQESISNNIFKPSDIYNLVVNSSVNAINVCMLKNAEALIMALGKVEPIDKQKAKKQIQKIILYGIEQYNEIFMQGVEG